MSIPISSQLRALWQVAESHLASISHIGGARVLPADASQTRALRRCLRACARTLCPEGAILMQAREDTAAPTQPLLKGWGKLGPKLFQFGKDTWKKVLQLNNLTS